MRRRFRDDALAVARPSSWSPSPTVIGAGIFLVGGGLLIWWSGSADSNFFINPVRTQLYNLTGYVGYFPDPSKRAATYLSQIQAASAATGVPASIIAGLGDRETLWGLSSALSQPGPAGTGDNGNGMGLMQIDQRYNPLSNWQDPQTNISAGAGIYSSYYSQLQSAGVDPSILTRAAASAYNAGVAGVLKAIQAGQDPDSVTTGGNYGLDVVSRAAKFSLS